MEQNTIIVDGFEYNIREQDWSIKHDNIHAAICSCYEILKQGDTFRGCLFCHKSSRSHHIIIASKDSTWWTRVLCIRCFLFLDWNKHKSQIEHILKEIVGKDVSAIIYDYCVAQYNDYAKTPPRPIAPWIGPDPF